MAPSSEPEADATERRTDEPTELRTISFRMRELQRLLAIRVEQENRRLEAEGLEPVSEREPVRESRFLEVAERD